MQLDSNNVQNKTNSVRYNYNPNSMVYNQTVFNDVNKQKKKMRPAKKVLSGIAIGLAGTTVLGMSAIVLPAMVSIFSSYRDYNKNRSNNNSYVYIDDSYASDFGDFERVNEITPIEGVISDTYLNLNGDIYSNTIARLDSKEFNYSYLEDYYLEECIQLYNNSEYNKETRNNILNSSNKIDANKLYQIVLKNNQEYMSGGTNAINCFFTEMQDSQIKDICNFMADYFNKSDDVDYFKLAFTLNNLKIFLNETSVANAYVNKELVLVVNPTMINMYESSLEMGGSLSPGEEVEDSVLAHEFEHIKQYVSNDFIESNGLEVGPFRKFDNAKVNSLYLSWLLEGAAEINSSEILNIEPHTYLKKIWYFNTYNLSRIFDSGYSVDGLVNSTFSSNLNEMYNGLNLNDSTSQRDFLELMYSIELTKSDCDDFWENYETKIGKELSDAEKLVIKKQIREEAIMKLTLNYYKGLVNAINNGSINDLETAFYFMRMWELDCYNHLEYSYNAESYEDSKDFVLWLDEINGIVCEGFANSLNTTQEDIEQRYKDYRMNVLENGSEKNNCDYSYLSNDKKEFIEMLEASFDFNNFSKISDVADSIEDTSMTR